METMHFGKHKGKRLCEVPADYLEWVVTGCARISVAFRQAVRAELIHRRHGLPPRRANAAGLDWETVTRQMLVAN